MAFGTVPNIFVNGTTADAGAVNDNFTAIIKAMIGLHKRDETIRFSVDHREGEIRAAVNLPLLGEITPELVEVTLAGVLEILNEATTTTPPHHPALALDAPSFGEMNGTGHETGEIELAALDAALGPVESRLIESAGEYLKSAA